jgi:hypothetical protein
MIYVSIAGERRRLDEVDSYWIHQQVGGRRDEEQSVCVQVEFDDPSGKWGLISHGCGSGGRGEFNPNSEQREIIEFWEKHRMNTSDFTSGNLNAFVQQLRHKH